MFWIEIMAYWYSLCFITSTFMPYYINHEWTFSHEWFMINWKFSQYKHLIHLPRATRCIESRDCGIFVLHNLFQKWPRVNSVVEWTPPIWWEIFICFVRGCIMDVECNNSLLRDISFKLHAQAKVRLQDKHLTFMHL